ncbi:MAG: methyltransferase domain-containing protein [Deltaproteobacteria bacterium]|nr:methyltransferase domain-containing protein [Deltaproteobacteria bacterium]
MSSDIVFDGLANDFERDIYESSKGYIRLNVLWHDLCEGLPQVRDGNWRILDAGGGMGQISIKLATLGNSLVLCDPSEEMLAKADSKLRAQGIKDRVQLVKGTIQRLSEQVSGKFDLILCHAVLEWIAVPKDALLSIRSLLQPGGYLSLMYYNQNAAIMTAMLSGDYITACKYLDGGSVPSGYKNQSHPLDPQVVRLWLQESGFDILQTSGIRIFHDHIPDELKKGQALDNLLMTEIRYRLSEPFASLGQHQHVICRLRA